MALAETLAASLITGEVVKTGGWLMITIIYKGSEEKLGKSRLEVILEEDLLAFGVGTDRDGQHWRVCMCVCGIVS